MEGSVSLLHPGKLTWNLKMNPWKRRFLLETIIFRFHVSFRGGMCFGLVWELEERKCWKNSSGKLLRKLRMSTCLAGSFDRSHFSPEKMVYKRPVAAFDGKSHAANDSPKFLGAKIWTNQLPTPLPTSPSPNAKMAGNFSFASFSLRTAAKRVVRRRPWKSKPSGFRWDKNAPKTWSLDSEKKKKTPRKKSPSETSIFFRKRGKANNQKFEPSIENDCSWILGTMSEHRKSLSPISPQPHFMSSRLGFGGAISKLEVNPWFLACNQAVGVVKNLSFERWASIDLHRLFFAAKNHGKCFMAEGSTAKAQTLSINCLPKILIFLKPGF